MNAIIKEAVPAEYSKIRSYVITQIAKAGDSPMRLASNRKLGEQFGVSHTTVVKALRDLISDGFLTVKSGRRGIFTCPARFNGHRNSKSIGVLYGDGKNVFITRLNSWFNFEIANALQGISYNYLIQNISLTSVKAKAAQEILSMGLNGVIWISPTEKMLPTVMELKAEGFPLLSAQTKIDGVSSMFIDVEGEYFKAASMMLDEGRRRIALVLLPGLRVKGPMEGVARAFAERGLPFDESWIITSADAADLLLRLKPDGICFASYMEEYYDMVVREFDTVNGCRLYSPQCNIFYTQHPYTGYVGYPNYAEPARLAAENLSAMLERSASVEPLQAKVNVEIKMANQMKGNAR